MSDEEAIGAIIDEMYAMISGPAGPRDWSRQRNSFLPEARQVRTWVDEQQRPAMKMMGLDEYAENTTPFFNANPFYEVETGRRIACSATWPTCGAITKRGPRQTTTAWSAAASTRSSFFAIPMRAGRSSP